MTPIEAPYPLATAIVGAVLLQHEKLSLRAAAGAAVTVAEIVYLVNLHAGA